MLLPGGHELIGPEEIPMQVTVGPISHVAEAFHHRRSGTRTCLSTTIRPVHAGNLIVNGGFESPSATPSGKIIEIYRREASPPGLPGLVNLGNGGGHPAGVRRSRGSSLFRGRSYQGSQRLYLDG